MKNLLLLLLFCPAFLFSQISLTSADFASSGDTVFMSRATDNTIDLLTTGANQNWDYSNLTPNSQAARVYKGMSGVSILVNFVFGAFAPTKYKASYYLPSTDLPVNQIGALLPVQISDLVQYSRKTTDSITLVGLSLAIDGNEVPIKSDTIETRYKYPLNYGDVHSSRGYTKLDMNPFYDAIWIQYRQRQTEVDGWGSITTPYGTFDALRIKHTINEKDSLRFVLFGSPTWIPLPIPKSYIYEWITNGEKAPVLKVVTTLIGGNETVTSIEYKDNNGILEVASNQIEIELYPNPVVDLISVKADFLNAFYSIIDAKGAIVASGKMGESINVSTLRSGHYELIVVSDNLSVRKRFIKQD